MLLCTIGAKEKLPVLLAFLHFTNQSYYKQQNKKQEEEEENQDYTLQYLGGFLVLLIEQLSSSRSGERFRYRINRSKLNNQI